MGAEEALELVDELIFQITGDRLSDLQRKVFKQAWAGKTYEAIAEQLGYSESHIKETGNELWKLLTKVLGEKVTKKNFRAALERKQRSLQHQSIAVNPQIVEDRLEIASIAPHTPLTTTSTDPNFVGREGAIAQLTCLVNQDAKIITIYAPGGVGKTKLACQYLDTQGFDKVLEIWMAKEIQNINSIESEVERWLQQDFGEEPGRDFGVNLERLRQKLRDPNQRIGVLIDNLEPALDKNGRFIESRRAYVELLRVLSDRGARSLTLITSRERLYDPSIEVRDYRLEGLDEVSWQEFFKGHGIQANFRTLKEMHFAYGGNAKAMQILSRAVQIDFSSDLEIFWQENQADLLLNPTLENLVSEQFDRLQIIDPDAYQLLCRLGCFRYQDVPVVPLNGIFCLMSDVSKTQRRRVVKSLQDRALIESKYSGYCLHPVIKSEAIKRIHTSNAWKIANKKIAEYWEKSTKNIIKPEDGLKQAEAYYHYINIEDYNSASKLILSEGERYSLIGRLRGFGMYSKCLEILRFLSQQSNISNSERQHISGFLADLHSISGESKEAALCYQEAIKIGLILKDKIHFYDCLAALGLLNLKTGEIQSSIELFKRILASHQDLETEALEKNILPLQRIGRKILVSAYSCLSFIYWLSKNSKKSLFYLKLASSQREWMQTQSGSWWELYGNYYFARSLCTHQFLDESKETCLFLYKTARTYSYPLAMGLFFSAVGEISLQRNQLVRAIKRFVKAEQIFREIGAKSDLTEVYFQIGLAYQALGEVEKGAEYRDKAIQLFEEMEAPRQVERVRQAFASSDSTAHN
ncbi:MAG: AAA family ATPase [Trichocoleus desertorum ATA4-8-CV12]|jgi:tetratricopeptide (TPR) repeat protein|nr:AAA family ATPase [Trichocoleus desertorum ATA4-8-CV12]